MWFKQTVGGISKEKNKRLALVHKNSSRWGKNNVFRNSKDGRPDLESRRKTKTNVFFKPACGVLLSKGKKDLHCPTPASGLCIPNLFKNQGFLKMIQENSNYKAGIDHLFSCVYVV